jgi:DNA topoisomerase IA
MGHVRDLPSKVSTWTSRINIEHYVDIMPGKSVWSPPQGAAKNCDKLYLATDLDREGRPSPGIWADLVFPETGPTG